MVKSGLIQKLCNMHPNILRKDIKKILDIIIFEITEALCNNEFDACEFRNFGRFSTKIRKARIGRNPASGNRINISQKRIVKWKASKVLLKRLNVN